MDALIQTKDKEWPDPKGQVQVAPMMLGLRDEVQPRPQPPPTSMIVGLTSHNNKLFAWTNNGEIWLFSWGGPGQQVAWVEMFNPANPGAIPIAAGVTGF